MTDCPPHHWVVPSLVGLDPKQLESDPSLRDWHCLRCEARKPPPAPLVPKPYGRT